MAKQILEWAIAVAYTNHVEKPEKYYIGVAGELDNQYYSALVTRYINGAITEKELKQAFLAEGKQICHHRRAKSGYNDDVRKWDARFVHWFDLIDGNTDIPPLMHSRTISCDGHSDDCEEVCCTYGDFVYTGRYGEDGEMLDYEDTGYYELASYDKALKQAEEEGWRFIGGYAYCPECVKSGKCHGTKEHFMGYRGLNQIGVKRNE